MGSFLKKSLSKNKRIKSFKLSFKLIAENINLRDFYPNYECILRIIFMCSGDSRSK